jgi:hypothetical protein
MTISASRTGAIGSSWPVPWEGSLWDTAWDVSWARECPAPPARRKARSRRSRAHEAVCRFIQEYVRGKDMPMAPSLPGYLFWRLPEVSVVLKESQDLSDHHKDAKSDDNYQHRELPSATLRLSLDRLAWIALRDRRDLIRSILNSLMRFHSIVLSKQTKVTLTHAWKMHMPSQHGRRTSSKAGGEEVIG